MTDLLPQPMVSRGRPAAGGGFTLIESVMSILIVGLMLVAALNTVGASKLAQMRNAERAAGPMLSQDLMAEALNQFYEEPEDSVKFGREGGESGGKREDYDDVDDYDGWVSNPPEYRNGDEIPGLDDWTRKVSVNWADSLFPQNNALTPSGIKRIKVEVFHKGRLVSTSTALRTSGWQDDDAPAYIPPKVLMFVNDLSAVTPLETARQIMLESLGFTVSKIDVLAHKDDISDALNDNDVAYVPSAITVDKGGEIYKSDKGVVSESKGFMKILGFCSSTKGSNDNRLVLLNTSHYITSPFSLGLLTITTANANLNKLNGNIGSGVVTLGNVNFDSSLALLETDALLHDGEKAAGRRVAMPWGNAGFDVGILNDDAKTILKRSLEWAAEMEQQ